MADDGAESAQQKYEDIAGKIESILLPVGLESRPFLIGWYNDLVAHKSFILDYNAHTLAFNIISSPSMFEQGFMPFITNYKCIDHTPKDPLDEFMSQIYVKVKSQLPEYDIDVIQDFEIDPVSRRPKVLVQTAAHVSGMARYYQRKDVEKDPWDEKTKIYGVSVHPKYGGWFAMRGVLIVKNILASHLPRVEPLDVVTGDEKKIELLEQYNFHWQDWAFRDIIPTDAKYSEQQKKYFSTPPANRKELLTEILQ